MCMCRNGNVKDNNDSLSLGVPARVVLNLQEWKNT